MPKIMPELRERFVKAARERLLRDRDLTIRQVAGDCGTAVGTVYNYFPSKEALLAAVMMEDWTACCERMRRDAARADGPLEALRATTGALRAFTGKYTPLWRSYAATKDNMEALATRHQRVIREIAGAVSQTLERFAVTGDACLPEILAELILYASRTGDGFERICAVLEKILA